MREHELPTWDDILSGALTELGRSRDGLSEAASWLRSDWRPVGSPLPTGAGDARATSQQLIVQAKALIDQAQNALEQVRDGTPS
jgi:hypothetical protein